MKSFYIRTFGCKLNQSDSDYVRSAMLDKGMRETAAPEEADLIVVNTCTVTHKADSGARQQIRRLKNFNPDATLIVTGCYAERDARILASMPEVDQVFGLRQKKELHQFVTGIVPENLDFGGIDHREVGSGGRSRAFLKVQEGCDLKCSFCVIRIVRGHSRSLPAEEVIHRLRSLAGRGFSEVVLTGIHLGLWGRDLGIRGVGKGMLHLLREIDRAEGMPKVRLNSLEPYVIKDEMLELMASGDRFAHHLHLSIQSGSQRILRAMRRRPDVASMRRVAERAHELMPDIGIGADVIVGFPGEEEEDFRETYDLLIGSPFTYAHVFAFSARPGTDAAAMKPVHNEDITERSARLRGAIAARNLAFRRSQIGKETTAVLLEQVDEDGRPIALTDNYVHVVLENLDENDIDGGALRRVRFTEADEESTVARLIPRRARVAATA